MINVGFRLVDQTICDHPPGVLASRPLRTLAFLDIQTLPG